MEARGGIRPATTQGRERQGIGAVAGEAKACYELALSYELGTGVTAVAVNLRQLDVLLEDLGAWWGRQAGGLPLPLGANAIPLPPTSWP